MSGRVVCLMTMLKFFDIQSNGLIPKIKRELEASGIVFIEGATSRAAVLKFSSKIGHVVGHRDSEVDGLTRIAHDPSRERERGFLGFSAKGLFPHTDRSSLQNPPNLLLTVCDQQAESGGESLLVNACRVYTAMLNDFIPSLQKLHDNNAAYFGNNDDYIAAPIFSRRQDGSIAVRFRLDDNVHFNGNMITEFGDFIALVRAHMHCINFDRGQGYLINNKQWLHGRRSFSGSREMWRVLIDRPFGIGLERMREGFNGETALTYAA